MSVVVIFHDDEQFLPEAIESVLAQGHADWELILADDGSTDRSTSIARSYEAAQPDRIRYVDHPGHENHGISATRNLGIAAARGHYVAFLDSDDVWESHKLEQQVALMDAHPEVGLLISASRYWHSWETGDEADDRVRLVGTGQDVTHHPPNLALDVYPLGRGVAPCPSCFLVRRKILDEVGGFEDQFTGLYEDQAFLAKVYLHARVHVSSRCWDRYRRHGGAVTLASSRSDYRRARRYFLAWYERYLDERGVETSELRRALRRAGWPVRHPHLARLRHELGVRRASFRRALRRAGSS